MSLFVISCTGGNSSKKPGSSHLIIRKNSRLRRNSNVSGFFYLAPPLTVTKHKRLNIANTDLSCWANNACQSYFQIEEGDLTASVPDQANAFLQTLVQSSHPYLLKLFSTNLLTVQPKLLAQSMPEFNTQIHFLAVQPTAQQVTLSLTAWLTDWATFLKTQQQCDPRDLWPLRHLIRVMRGHDLHQQKYDDKDKYKDDDKDKYI